MRLVASAPGKLVVVGEFAVLHGAPALVMAVDRRVSIVFESVPGAGSASYLDAPGIGLHGHRLRFEADGIHHGSPLAHGDNRLGVLTQAFNEGIAHVVARGWRLPGGLGTLPGSLAIRVDSSAFVGDGGAKLGFGSSAAVTVAALAGLIAVCLGEAVAPSEIMRAAVRAHRRAQGGGSGIDVAAACMGGALAFRLDAAGEPHVESLALPSSIRVAAVWSGEAQSTPAILAKVAEFRAREPQTHAEHMAFLSKTSGTGIEAVRAADAGGLLEAIRACGEGLLALGRASGVELVSAWHQQAAAIVAGAGGAYKPSGAGGDLGLVVCDGEASAAQVAMALSEAGVNTWPVVADGAGVAIDRLE